MSISEQSARARKQRLSTTGSVHDGKFTADGALKAYYYLENRQPRTPLREKAQAQRERNAEAWYRVRSRKWEDFMLSYVYDKLNG